MDNSVYNCDIINLGKVQNPAGNITILEGKKNIPFDIRRVYYIYDIPGGADRGGHAHKELTQLFIAASGSFSVLLNDGINRKVILMSRPDYALIVKPGIWRELFDFSSGAICLVAASDLYDTADYIRDYSLFNKYKAGEQH